MKKVFKKTSVKNLSPYYQFGIDYFGPFLYGFTKWLYTSLKKAQIHRVYFFSRDGHIVCQTPHRILIAEMPDPSYIHLWKKNKRDVSVPFSDLYTTIW